MESVQPEVHRPILVSVVLLALLLSSAALAKSKPKPIELSGYTQLRYERFDGKEDGGDPIREYNVGRARLKLTAQPNDLLKIAVQVDAAEERWELKTATAAYDLGKKREFAIGQMDWPFGYEVPNSSSEREAPERALAFRRLFPGQKDRGMTVEGKLGKGVDWVVGLFDGSGTDEVNYTIRDARGDEIGEGSKLITSDYNSHRDIVGHLAWNRGNAEFGVSSYIGKGIWNKKRTKILDEKKERYGAEFRYLGDKWAVKTEWVRGRGVDESDKDFNYSDWISGYYTQLSYNLDPRNTLVARYSTVSQDPNEPDLGRRSAWDLGVLRWLDSRNRVRLFYQVNTESAEPIDNDGFTAEWMVVY